MSAGDQPVWWRSLVSGAREERCGTLHAAASCYDIILTLGAGPGAPLEVFWIEPNTRVAIVPLRLMPPLGRIA